MFENPKGYIWMDGKFVIWDEANIHILSHTLHYGSGVFEGERAYNGKIFKMTEHHERLHQSADMLNFKIPYSVTELNQAAYQLLKLNNLSNAYLRPVAWHGAEALTVASHKNSVHVAIAACEWKPYFSTTKGLKLMWSDWVRPAPNMAPVLAKANGLYIISTLSKNKAEASGYNDALMLDHRGYIAECTGANVFMVKNGLVYTPIADCFLNGITRQTIIALLNDLQIPVMQKHLMPEEILNADEVFITGTAAEVQSVILIDNKVYAEGPITRLMKDRYLNLVTNHVAEMPFVN